MKQITISAIITPTDDNLTSEDVLAHLRSLGLVVRLYQADVARVALNTMDLPNTAWLHIPNDDSEGYRLVEGSRDTDGRELTNEEVTRLQETAVCVEFHALFSRADRYGAPSYATDDAFAAGIAGEHGFRVAEDDDFEVHAEDCGDDTGERMWLKLAIPA